MHRCEPPFAAASSAVAASAVEGPSVAAVAAVAGAAVVVVGTGIEGDSVGLFAWFLVVEEGRRLVALPIRFHIRILARYPRFVSVASRCVGG